MFEFTITVLGLLFGSFANVCIWRIPRGEEIVRTPSHCPACGAGISWYDNIPLASFLLLLGRCRSCHARIPWRYPLVEAACAALFLVLYARFGRDWRLLGYLPLAWALLVTTAVDLRHYVIPEAISRGGTAFALALAGAAALFPPLGLSVSGLGAAGRFAPLADALAGAAVGGGLIALVAWFGRRWYRQEAMGSGDIELAAMIGAFLGWKGVLLAIFLAVLTGSVAGLGLLGLGRAKDTNELNRTVYADDPLVRDAVGPVAAKAAVPFGPFLALGAMLSALFGSRLIGWYGGLFR